MTTTKFMCAGAVLTASLLHSACSTTGSNRVFAPLPPVDPATAVTLKVRSTIRETEVVHNHILRIDGQRIGLFEQDGRASYQISPGPHLLGLSCHSRAIRDDSTEPDLPHNYNVADGNTTLDIEPEPGETLCLKIKPALLNCAAFELVENTYCAYQ